MHLVPNRSAEAAPPAVGPRVGDSVVLIGMERPSVAFAGEIVATLQNQMVLVRGRLDLGGTRTDDVRAKWCPVRPTKLPFGPTVRFACYPRTE